MIGDLKAIKRVVDPRGILGAGLRGYGPSGRSIIKVVTGADVAPPARKTRKGSAT